MRFKRHLDLIKDFKDYISPYIYDEVQKTLRPNKNFKDYISNHRILFNHAITINLIKLHMYCVFNKNRKYKYYMRTSWLKSLIKKDYK